tara:strand:+ start:123 stop:452 length:330 start_codon:yes stop_codon:yes gene_type:complete
VKGEKRFSSILKTQMKKGVMRFFLSPFIFIFELIGFLLSAAFVYGLALIVGVMILWYGISKLESDKMVYINEVVETVTELPGLVCERFDGCRLMWDKYGTEYCPTCVNK